MFCKAVTSGDEGDAERVGGRGGLADDVSINCGDGDLGCVADMVLQCRVLIAVFLFSTVWDDYICFPPK